MTGGFLRLTGAVAVGVGLSLTFAPANAWFVAPLAVALFVWVAREERWWTAAVWGLIAGATFAFVTLQWLNPVGFDTVAMLGVVYGLWFALLGLGISIVWRLPLAPLWVASLWVLTELLFSIFPFGGFSWLRLAFGQSDGIFVGLARVVGVAGLSFAVALVGALLARFIERVFDFNKSQSKLRSGLGTAGVAAIAAVVIIAAWVGSGLNAPASGDGSLTVALVQGGVPGTGLNSLGEKTKVIQNHVEATKKLAKSVQQGQVVQPDLVIWPENSTDIDPISNLGVRSQIDAAADAINAPVLVGAVRTNNTTPVTLHNSAILWKPKTGAGEEYVKQHLVPFGEYMPMRDVVSSITDRVALVPYDFVSGDSPGVFSVDGTKFGDLICYEILNDSVMRGVLDQQVPLLVLQANNATYTHDGPGGLTEAEQLLNITRIRAVEASRSIVVATTNGITAAVNRSGEVMEQIPPFEAGALVIAVPLEEDESLATSLGQYFEYVIALLGLGALVAGIVGCTRKISE